MLPSCLCPLKKNAGTRSRWAVFGGQCGGGCCNFKALIEIEIEVGPGYVQQSIKSPESYFTGQSTLSEQKEAKAGVRPA
jgi:hypothetical protein